ncbi:MAG: transcription-repair coupling factor [Eubacterium sp.]|nr:transcription-repair coupling factor [Eubacterium sp.]
MTGNVSAVFGVSGSRSAYEASKIIKENKGKYLIITASEGRAREMAEDVSYFAGKKTMYVPHEDNFFLGYEARDHEQLMKRLNALHFLRTDDEAVIAAPVSAAIKKTVPHRVFEQEKVVLRRGESCDLGSLKESLQRLGYERLPIVESRGSCSIRGDIFDVFTPEADDPYRVEFFDDEIESIRSFDIDTQRSIEQLTEITIGPCEQLISDREVFRKASEKIRKEYDDQIRRMSKSEDRTEAVRTLEKRRDTLLGYVEDMTNIQLLENYVRFFYDSPEYIWDYMETGTVIIDDPDRIIEFLDAREQELYEDFQTMLEHGEVVPGDEALLTGKGDLMHAFESGSVYVLAPFSKQLKGIDRYKEIRDVESRQMTSYNGQMDVLSQEIKSYRKQGYEITIAASTAEREKNLKEFLVREDLYSGVKVGRGMLTEGALIADDKVCFISDRDIFGESRRAAAKRRKHKEGDVLRDFSDLTEGDYVVHENRGIGKFLGIQKLSVEGREKDYLKIKYAGTDMLYVPVERFDLVQKYIGSEGAAPKLSRLAGNEWKLTKERAKAAIAEMTEELVDLYAKRKMKKGFAFAKDDVWQREFEDRFPFVETEDQLRAAKEIKRDMEKPESMDRLLLGDVGFGKTEVAARAVCKCILSGKQAAILVPTTLLADQHYYTLKDRFSSLPCRVEMMSRFRSDAENKATAEAIANGSVDIVIGTHRLLSDDVRFKDLGLLVVDEEQRFGVAHKEKIKKLKENVDVLTLSATPIPRTLNMSLSGIKDMSLISEPPEERYPVQTYVMEQNDQLIREAILRETERGGQVFIVFNRVRGIGVVAKHIAAIVPEVKIAVGHGQMNEHALEKVMLSFVEHEVDVLIATTIIESGIDIQNANTLIVLDSDRFGLAQLYQLKGRVGRSNRIAYAYFMYEKDKVLTELAEKRLRAIKEFTEFGSGFKVAMRDLELRGAGNLLGSEQSGHMMNIGYELYCKLVDEHIRKLRGEKIDEDHPESQIDIRISANIPDWYIEDEAVKLDMYKRISFIKTFAEESDIIEELRDRFGDVPRETRDLIKIARIKGLADELRVKRVYEQEKHVIFSFDQYSRITAESIIAINAEFGLRSFIHGGNKPYIRVLTDESGRLDDTIKLLELLKGDKADAV